MDQPPEKPTEFDRYAEDYAELIRDPLRVKFSSDRFFAERKLQEIRGFCDRLGMKTEGMGWLDVGCGRGDLLRLGQTCFRAASGCDPSVGMLEFCSDLDVRHQEAIDVLPYETGSFDFITLVGVYHHVALDRRLALTNEVRRLLRPGGILCTIEHNPWNPVTRRIVSRSPVDVDANLLSVREMRRLMSSAGLSVVGTRFFLFFPERLHKHFHAVEQALHGIPMGGQYAVFGQKRPRR